MQQHWKQWKGKLKAALTKFKDKRQDCTAEKVPEQQPHPQQRASTAAPCPSATVDRDGGAGGGLGRPHGLTGRQSLDSRMGQGAPFLNTAAGAGAQLQRAASDGDPANAGAFNAAAEAHHHHHQQQQHAGQAPLDGSGAPLKPPLPPPPTQQQQPPQHRWEQQGSSQVLVCGTGGANSVEAHMQSCPASPTGAGAAAAAAGAAGAAGDGGAQQQQQPQHAGAAGQAAGAGAAAAAGTAPAAALHSHHRAEASRMVGDDELGCCPPYAVKAVCGLRYTMEDKWAVVPNLIQVPLALTSPPAPAKRAKKGGGGGSGAPGTAGCGCMLASSKVLAKVSPSARSAAAASAAAAAQRERELAKASPDRQRLIGGGHHGSDELEAAAGQGLGGGEDGSGAAAAAAAAAATGADPAVGGAAAAAAAADGGGAVAQEMDPLHYFGVFDGHGGADAARHCAQRMHQVVCETILAMLGPELAAVATTSALAGDCSLANGQARDPAHQRQPQPQQPEQQKQEPEQEQPGQRQQQQQPASGGDDASAMPTSMDSSSSSSHQLPPLQPPPCGGAVPAPCGTSSSGSTSSVAAAAAAGAAAGAAAVAAPADLAASGGAWLLPVLSRSFVALDHEFGALSEGSYVGSTAVVVLMGAGRMWVAHAGDSRAILGRAGGLQVLTSDHKASRGDEVARVQAAGGHVWWDRVMGELAVSRAIGDHCLRPYVIAEPEVLMVDRTPQDEVLIMASDGLWDVLGNQEAVDLALHSLEAAEMTGYAGVAAAKRSASALTKAALERGTRDNVTVLVIDLRPRSPNGGGAAAASSSSSSRSSSRHTASSSHRSSSSSKSSRLGSSKSSGRRTTVAAPAAVPAAPAPVVPAAAAAPAAAAPAPLSAVAVNGAAGVATAADGTSGGGGGGLERAASGAETSALLTQQLQPSHQPPMRAGTGI